MNKVDILAVASGGGHLEQMLKIMEPIAEGRLIGLCTTAILDGPPDGFDCIDTVVDCNKNEPFNTLLCLIQVVMVFFRASPKLVLSTGAAPGLLMILVARISGCKSIWIDSVANGERLSLSGRVAKKFATITLSQWEHVAKQEGVTYKGSVL